MHVNHRQWLPAIAGLMLIGTGAVAGTIEKKHPNGTIRLRYAINSVGDKNGLYEEFYPTGKLKIKATYKADKLDGLYARYRENGQPELAATYKDGKLHGTLTQYGNGKPLLTQTFKEGQLLYPRSLDDMRKKISQIVQAPAHPNLRPEMGAALRRLQVYRYLAEVPHEDLAVDEQLTREAQIAAFMLEKLGRLDHSPKNPGLPEAEYQLGCSGAKYGNLAMGQQRYDLVIDTWMDDAGPAGSDQWLGHRRWCINPQMLKVGFGKSGPYYVMWAQDKSRPQLPAFDCVSFPARGFMPLEYFRADYYWNVTINPAKYRLPDKTVQPKVYYLDRQWNKVGEPLKLDYSAVNDFDFGMPGCLIFRPPLGAVAPGRRFLVEIEGLQAKHDKKTDPISYVVEFTTLR